MTPSATGTRCVNSSNIAGPDSATELKLATVRSSISLRRCATSTAESVTGPAAAMASSTTCIAGCTDIARPPTFDFARTVVLHGRDPERSSTDSPTVAKMDPSSHEQQIRNLLYLYMAATDNGDFDTR